MCFWIMVWSQQAECEGVDSGTLNIPAASKIDLVFFSFHAVIVICILDFLDKSILGSNSGNITHWNWLIWIFSGCSGNSQPARICSSPVDYVTTEPRKLSGPSQGRVLRRLRVLRWLTGLGRPTKYKRSREPNCGEDQANEMPKKATPPTHRKGISKGFWSWLLSLCITQTPYTDGPWRSLCKNVSWPKYLPKRV